jgi:hypothetical protein
MIIHNPILTGSLTLNNVNLSTGNLVTTGSNTFVGNQILSGSLTVSGSVSATGTLTAQTLVVQTVTSSVLYSSGSNIFGNNIANTQVMTGSVTVTGSLAVVTNGTEFQVSSTGVNIGNALTDSHVISGSVTINPSGLFVSSSGNVGIGTTNPTTKFDLSGSIGNFQVASSGAEIFLTRNDNNDILATGGTTSGITIGAQSYVRFSTGTGYTERVRINSSGSVTIGTTSLTGWGANDRILKIQGSSGVSVVQAVSSDAGCAVWLYSGASSGDNPSVIYLKDLRFGSATDLGTGGYNERMRITSAGNVGIGVTSPSYKFHTVSPDNNTTSFAAFSALNLTQHVEMWYGGIRMGGSNIHIDMNLAAKGSVGVMNFITNGSTRMQIDGSGNIGAPSGTNIYNASDLRLKRNISTINDGLNKIMELNPVKFNWVENYVVSEENKDMLGFIAQEIQEVIPEAVESFANGNTITIGETLIENPLRVNEKFIIPVLVKAIQEQQAQIEELKSQINK